jgi:hypothetical protein
MYSSWQILYSILIAAGPWHVGQRVPHGRKIKTHFFTTRSVRLNFFFIKKKLLNVGPPASVTLLWESEAAMPWIQLMVFKKLLNLIIFLSRARAHDWRTPVFLFSCYIRIAEQDEHCKLSLKALYTRGSFRVETIIINDIQVLYISKPAKDLLLIDASRLAENDSGRVRKGCLQGAAGLIFPMMISIYLRYHELCI